MCDIAYQVFEAPRSSQLSGLTHPTPSTSTIGSGCGEFSDRLSRLDQMMQNLCTQIQGSPSNQNNFNMNRSGSKNSSRGSGRFKDKNNISYSHKTCGIKARKCEPSIFSKNTPVSHNNSKSLQTKKSFGPDGEL